MTELSSKEKGNITEVECMLAFLKLGYNVLTPYGDCERYDFVVEVNNNFYKIQVKTARDGDEEQSNFIFSCTSSHVNANRVAHQYYTKEEIDFFATFYKGKCYLVPVEECGKDKRLRLEPTKSGQIIGVNWAKDYELEVQLSKL